MDPNLQTARVRLVALMIVEALLSGCASDYVRIRPNPGGWLVDRPPEPTDESFYVSIGAKQFEEFGFDRARASREVSKRLVREYKLCQTGYTLLVNERFKTGDYGFGWTVRCRDRSAGGAG